MNMVLTFCCGYIASTQWIHVINLAICVMVASLALKIADVKLKGVGKFVQSEQYTRATLNAKIPSVT